MGADAADIGMTIHAHPTLSETVAFAAEAFEGTLTDMYLPKKIYEALPAAYISTGTLFILGAAYIGFGHWTMTGYLAVGLSCVFAGLTVNSIRRRQRSQSKARAR